MLLATLIFNRYNLWITLLRTIFHQAPIFISIFFSPSTYSPPPHKLLTFDSPFMSINNKQFFFKSHILQHCGILNISSFFSHFLCHFFLICIFCCFSFLHISISFSLSLPFCLSPPPVFLSFYLPTNTSLYTHNTHAQAKL